MDLILWFVWEENIWLLSVESCLGNIARYGASASRIPTTIGRINRKRVSGTPILWCFIIRKYRNMSVVLLCFNCCWECCWKAVSAIFITVQILVAAVHTANGDTDNDFLLFYSFCATGVYEGYADLANVMRRRQTHCSTRSISFCVLRWTFDVTISTCYTHFTYYRIIPRTIVINGVWIPTQNPSSDISFFPPNNNKCASLAFWLQPEPKLSSSLRVLHNINATQTSQNC